MRHPREPHRRHPPQGDQGPDHHLEQLRHRRQGARHPAGERAGQEDGLQLRRREQDVRAAVPRGEAGGRAEAAGHAGRAHPRRRRRHPGVLHGDRLRHRGGRGQGDARVRRAQLRAGARADGGLRHRQGLEGRHVRQPRLPEDGAQLQPDDGGRRAHDDRRGRGAGRTGRARARPGALAGHLRDARDQGGGVRKADRAAHGPQAGAA